MKQILVMMAVVVLVGCSNETPETSQAAEAEPQVVTKPTPEPTPEPTPVSPPDEKLIADPIVERAVREELEKPDGELTEADLEKVTFLDLTFHDLEDTQITDEGLKGLAKLQNIEKLFLWNTQITDEGLKEVAKLQKLTGLALEGTKVTKAGVAELKKALPNCTIYGP